MSWYSGSPSVGDVLTFTVHEANDIGFKVTLDAYDNSEGFLPFSELSSKKIKKNPAAFLKAGSKHCGLVTDNSDVITYISLKDVTKEQQELETQRHCNNGRLFALCQRLSRLPGHNFTESQWHHQFRRALDKYLNKSNETVAEGCDEDEAEDEAEDETPMHPIDIISSRQNIMNNKYLPPDYHAIIANHHATLFGIKPATLTMIVTILTFDMNGNDRVKSVLSKIMSDVGTFTDTQLYQDQSKYNLSINPVALPDFQIVITAYLESVCQNAADLITHHLHDAKFDIMEVKSRNLTSVA